MHHLQADLHNSKLKLNELRLMEGRFQVFKQAICLLKARDLKNVWKTIEFLIVAKFELKRQLV